MPVQYRGAALAAVLFFAGGAVAAPCTTADAEAKPGRWKGRALPSLKKGPVRAVLQDLGRMLEAVLADPRGYEPEWRGVLEDARGPGAGPAVPYTLAAPFFSYSCDGQAITQGAETGASAYLQINSLKGLLTHTGELNGRETLWLRASTSTRNGHPYVEYTEPGSTTRLWLITRPDSPPFRALSRAEYLAEARLEVAAAAAAKGAGGDDAARAALEAMDREGSAEAAELARPAVVLEAPTAFRGFVDAEPAGRHVVRWEPAAVQGTKHHPQFLVVRIREVPADSVSVEVSRRLMDGLDFEALARLLDPKAVAALPPAPKVSPPPRRRSRRH